MILDEIVSETRNSLPLRKKQIPLEELQQMISLRTPARDFKNALTGSRIRLIAEVKKASPSKGVICPNFNPLAIAKIYAENGAAAISILTERNYFQGHIDYLDQIDKSLGENHPPLLRKDFILEPYQVYESRAFGADAILLIAAILSYRELIDLFELGRRLGLHCLVEIHNEDEAARAVACGAQIVGINNRDLKTFEVNLDTTARLRSLIPAGHIVVSESGIKNRQDMQQLQEWNVNAALVGETLMASPDIAARMNELL